MAMRNNELSDIDNVYIPFTIFGKDEEGKFFIKDKTSVKLSNVMGEFGNTFSRINHISMNLKVSAISPLRLYEYDKDYGYYRLLHMVYNEATNEKILEDSTKITDVDRLYILCLNTGTDKVFHPDSTIFLVSDVVNLKDVYEDYVNFSKHIFEDNTVDTEYGIIDLNDLLEGNIPEFELLYMDKAYAIHTMYNVAKADYFHYKKIVDKLETVFKQIDYSDEMIFKKGTHSWHTILMKELQAETKTLIL
jgi:hypothetical protein